MPPSRTSSTPRALARLRLLALLVPALLAGCTLTGEGDPAESTLACPAPEGEGGWRIAAYASEGAAPRTIPMPEGGGFDANLQMILTSEETCVAGAFQGLPSAAELRLTFLEIANGQITVRVPGLDGTPSVTCDVATQKEAGSGEAGEHLTYRVEPMPEGCRIVLQPVAGAPLDAAHVEWSLSGLEENGSMRFIAEAS